MSNGFFVGFIIAVACPPMGVALVVVWILVVILDELLKPDPYKEQRKKWNKEHPADQR